MWFKNIPVLPYLLCCLWLSGLTPDTHSLSSKTFILTGYYVITISHSHTLRCFCSSQLTFNICLGLNFLLIYIHGLHIDNNNFSLGGQDHVCTHRLVLYFQLQNKCFFALQIIQILPNCRSVHTNNIKRNLPPDSSQCQSTQTCISTV